MKLKSYKRSVNSSTKIVAAEDIKTMLVTKLIDNGYDESCQGFDEWVESQTKQIEEIAKMSEEPVSQEMIDKWYEAAKEGKIKGIDSLEIKCSSDISDRDDVYDWLIDMLIEDDGLQEYLVDTFGIVDIDGVYNIDYQDLLDWINDQPSLKDIFPERFPEVFEWYENGCQYVEECSSIQSSTDVEEVLTFFKNKLGWDTSREDVRSYAEGVAEYMDMSEEAYEHEGETTPYTLDQWYKDTKMNYPEEIEEFESEKIETGCHEDVTAASRYDDSDYFDELFVAIDNAIEAQGFKSVCRFLDDDYLEIQLFYEDDEEFDNAIYTYVTELDVIEPNLEDVESDAEIIADDVVEEYYNSGGTESGQFEEIESKQVLDSDGFMTDYTMYRDNDDGTYFFMFGDKDMYGPDRNWADHEEETEEGAYEWFESYEGFEDEEDEY